MKIPTIDYSINLTQVLPWQYNTAVRLTSLIASKQNWYDVNSTQFWEDWYNNVFNLLTANDFGLSIWCIILNAPYLIEITPVTKPVWGFNSNPSKNHNVNFTRGTFASSGGSSRIILTTEEQRLFLQLRYFQLVSRGDVIFTNNFLNLLFNNPDGIYQGGAWIIDNFDMTVTYFFNCPISNALLQAIEEYDVLPRLAGVNISYEVV